jgi:hypothetical protein
MTNAICGEFSSPLPGRILFWAIANPGMLSPANFQQPSGLGNVDLNAALKLFPNEGFTKRCLGRQNCKPRSLPTTPLYTFRHAA